jgi:hypothetical protein
MKQTEEETARHDGQPIRVVLITRSSDARAC